MPIIINTKVTMIGVQFKFSRLILPFSLTLFGNRKKNEVNINHIKLIVPNIIEYLPKLKGPYLKFLPYTKSLKNIGIKYDIWKPIVVILVTAQNAVSFISI